MTIEEIVREGLDIHEHTLSENEKRIKIKEFFKDEK